MLKIFLIMNMLDLFQGKRVVVGPILFAFPLDAITVSATRWRCGEKKQGPRRKQCGSCSHIPQRLTGSSAFIILSSGSSPLAVFLSAFMHFPAALLRSVWRGSLPRLILEVSVWCWAQLFAPCVLLKSLAVNSTCWAANKPAYRLHVSGWVCGLLLFFKLKVCRSGQEIVLSDPDWTPNECPLPLMCLYIMVSVCGEGAGGCF